MLGPGFNAQYEVLTRTCVGVVMDGIGNVVRDSTSDGSPILECVHAFIVVVVAMPVEYKVDVAQDRKKDVDAAKFRRSSQDI